MNPTTCLQCGQPLDEYGAYSHEGEFFCSPKCIHSFKIDIATSNVDEQILEALVLKDDKGRHYIPSPLFFSY